MVDAVTANEGWLGRLVESLQAKGISVISPVREGEMVLFRKIGSADEIATGVRGQAVMDTLQIGCLPGQTRSVVHDLAADLSECVVD